MSQYSQQIFQEEAVRALTKCVKDTDIKIKIWCLKAMGKAGTKAKAEQIRNVLLEQYKTDPTVRDTIVRSFSIRQDDSKQVQETLLESLKKTENPDEQETLLTYFEKFGSGSSVIDVVAETFKKSESPKVRTAAVTTLATRAQGQDAVVAILAQCASEHESNETPLVLTCLSGLQQQAKKDARAWQAVDKTLESEDADVVYATLDLINALPESQNEKISQKLLGLIGELEDQDTLERAVLALGVAGNGSESITEALRNQLESKTASEGVRIASALVLGKQSTQFPEKPRELLGKCSKQEKSQSLRTACQLGMQEIEARVPASAPAASPAPEKATEKTDGKTEEKAAESKSEKS